MILDEVLLGKQFSEDIAKVQRDLPQDEWRNTPQKQNVSRSAREAAVANTMLGGVELRLKAMTVTELVKSLKTLSYPDGVMTHKFAGVEYYVYEIGNQRILHEIMSRPKSELEILPKLADDGVVVFEGAQGPGDTLTEVINSRILRNK